ncbi:MAG: aldo/keto reductase [Clostridiales Family XIII bacterium]|jgi:aryl-alcohol dehydrogenase-like predicted oxidoreductase|nr:aldo/keto reductase [Clostridiales Family XIII bacterium]
MEYIDFGRTGMKASRTGFGALPIQRCNSDEATRILRRAYDGGVNFYDTANGYSDSEEKIGRALKDVRGNIIIASKTMAGTPEKMREHLETSLRRLQTDYLDLYQFHNLYPTDEMLDTMEDFIKEGKVLHLGLTLHQRALAFEAIRSGKFESLQFPLSGLSNEDDFLLAQACGEAGMGFVAMKALSGGLVRDIEANFAVLRSKGNIIPIWGIQRIEELEEFLDLGEKKPPLSEAHLASMEREKAALGDHFCRGCGYCLPCPADIDLSMAPRMNLFMLRAPYQPMLAKKEQEKMARIENCTECHACAARCPYGLKPYELVKEQLAWYKRFLEEHKDELPQ